jgi:histidinol-phosphate aminotransferase
MAEYDKPPELYDGLRLHQNENTAGCSPRVLAALAALRPDQVGFYPPYSRAIDACARHFGVAASEIALTNGLDEGILATAITVLKPPADSGPRQGSGQGPRQVSGPEPPEAIVPQPAFEIFQLNTTVAGGRVVAVPPRPDFSFPLDRVVEAITPRTRLVFITNPNNPTGTSTTADDIVDVARRLPPGGIVFVDEAYADFAGGRTFIPHLRSTTNVIVGRTFAKAYGLAGLRLGALIGVPETLDPIRSAIGVYSVNVAAAVAVEAALTDQPFVDDYLRQVSESKTLVYELCARLQLHYWRSDANFVLIRVGPDASRVVAEAAARGIYLRDRSSEPGCEGCIRITTGIVEHTRRGLAVLEEVLCVAR